MAGQVGQLLKGGEGEPAGGCDEEARLEVEVEEGGEVGDGREVGVWEGPAVEPQGVQGGEAGKRFRRGGLDAVEGQAAQVGAGCSQACGQVDVGDVGGAVCVLDGQGLEAR